MSFSIKRAVKLATNPASMLDYGSGQKPGSQNPYAPVDPSGILKVDTRNPYLAELSKPYASFDQYVSQISAPSSVQAVQKEIEGQQYQNTLRDIGRATDVSVGRGVKGYLDRGLIGDGNDSDIARVGLAQLAQQGQEAGANAALEYQGMDLQRLAEKEAALREAYGQQYQTDVASRGALVSAGEAEAARKQQQQNDYYAILSGLYNQGANRQQQGYQGGYLDSILRNVNISLGGK